MRSYEEYLVHITELTTRALYRKEWGVVRAIRNESLLLAQELEATDGSLSEDLNPDRPPDTENPPDKELIGKSLKWESLRKSVELGLAAMPSPFKSSELMSWLDRTYPDNAYKRGSVQTFLTMHKKSRVLVKEGKVQGTAQSYWRYIPNRRVVDNSNPALLPGQPKG